MSVALMGQKQRLAATVVVAKLEGVMGDGRAW
jgi:hypothetical protein